MDPHASPFLLLFVYIPPLVASLMTPDDCCLLAGDVPHVSHSRFPSPAVTLTASLVDAQRRELQRLLRPHPPFTRHSLRPLHAVSRHVISSVISCGLLCTRQLLTDVLAVGTSAHHTRCLLGCCSVAAHGRLQGLWLFV